MLIYSDCQIVVTVQIYTLFDSTLTGSHYSRYMDTKYTVKTKLSYTLDLSRYLTYYAERLAECSSRTGPNGEIFEL